MATLSRTRKSQHRDVPLPRGARSPLDALKSEQSWDSLAPFASLVYRTSP